MPDDHDLDEDDHDLDAALAARAELLAALAAEPFWGNRAKLRYQLYLLNEMINHLLDPQCHVSS